jgi:hypothetical protein
MMDWYFSFQSKVYITEVYITLNTGNPLNLLIKVCWAPCASTIKVKIAVHEIGS